MKKNTIKVLATLVFGIFAFAQSAFANHDPACISDIDYTGMGTYAGNYTHSGSDHVWIIFDANDGDVISGPYSSSFNTYYWLYKSNGGPLAVGDCPGVDMTQVYSTGGYTESEIPTSGTFSYTVPAGGAGQYAVQIDAYLGGSGTYTLTLSGASGGCATTNTFAPMMTSGLYAGAGANDAETYYWGLSTGHIKANPSGGVGPYTYSWSNSAGYAMKGTSNMKARLFYPTGPTWVKVAITDAGAGCTIEDSVYIDWVDYTCNQPDLWFYEMCNINTNTSVCIAGTRNMRDSVKTGNYVFGPCNQPVKTGAIAQSELGVNVFPNPSNGNFTYIVMGDADATFNTQVMDINGRVLFAESFTSSSTISSRQISLQGFAAGVYVIKVSSNDASTVERIIIQ